MSSYYKGSKQTLWLEPQNGRLFSKTSKYWTKWPGLPESEMALPLILIYFNRLNGIIPARLEGYF
jgi:hypothetical protein